MRAAVIREPGTIEVTDVVDPTPGAGDVVVRVGACGICGTDLHIADGEFPPTPYPIVPGHEFAGEVVAVGAAVANARVGNRVAVDPSLFCGRCAECRRGRGNLCENWGATGDTVDGAFAEYVSVPAHTVYALPDELGWAEAALVEPVSCAVHGIQRLGVEVGDRVLVVGAGTMGLLIQQLAIRAGGVVSVVDRNTAKLPMATELAAHATAASVEELDAPPFDVAVDATGAPPAIEAAFDALRRGGRLQIFGVAAAEARVNLSPFRIYNDEITIVGSMAVLNSYGKALDLVASGAVQVAPLVSATLPLSQFPEALQRVRDGAGFKVQIDPSAG
ncbi:MAG: alcohol dehydrogenase catalytic domain-containing protein [Streptosporangiales bacterium]|nr:alcohol dehydrogenase catalytic domain-containing protein [Streptosporangiales bacterium]